MSIWFHPAAEIEHLDHVAYYESRQKGLGSGYLTEFEKILAAVTQGPNYYPLIGIGEIRRAHLRRFPMTILYREHGPDLHILAVTHKRRRPTYWVTRL